MNGILRRLAAGAAGLALLVAPTGVAAAKPHYAKTEVQKAVGKCIATVMGGALLGALLGGRNRGRGAVIGAGVGAAACALIMAAAKRQDRILAAQQAAARSGSDYVDTFADENGNPMRVVSRGEAIQAPPKLIPVAYEVGGQKLVSPELPGPDFQCRKQSAELTGSDGTTSVPGQIWCRTPEGDYAPYAEAA